MMTYHCAGKLIFVRSIPGDGIVLAKGSKAKGLASIPETCWCVSALSRRASSHYPTSIRRYIFKGEIAGIDQFFEFLRAASYACNIVDPIAGHIRIRIVESAAVSGSSFIYARTWT